MKDPTTVWTNSSGAWPSITADNITVPGDGTGTEWIAEFLSDFWGSRQNLLEMAGLTPDGATDADGASQAYEAMQLCFGNPGELVPWFGYDDPTTVVPGARLLIMTGQVVLIADYPELDNACYVQDANNNDGNLLGFVRTSDAGGTTPNVAGPYIIIPDMEGLHIRGYDPTAKEDVYGGVRVFPDKQSSATRIHGHELRTLATAQYADQVSLAGSSGTSETAFDEEASAVADRLQAREISGEMLGGNPDVETRVVNAQVRWCVRY